MVTSQDSAQPVTNSKIWKTDPGASAGLYVTAKEAYLVGNSKNFVAANDVGIQLCGPVTTLCMGEQIRQGGIFVRMPDFIQMIPQTIVTPIPNQIPFPPIAFPLAILSGLAFFIAMLAITK